LVACSGSDDEKKNIEKKSRHAAIYYRCFRIRIVCWIITLSSRDKLLTKLIPNILPSIGVVTHDKRGQEKRSLNMNTKRGVGCKLIKHTRKGYVFWRSMVLKHVVILSMR